MSAQTQTLSSLQLELLKLFSRRVSDNDLIEIKNMLADYFANKAMNEADKVWKAKNFSDSDAEYLVQQHFRTSY